jgi:hypothetical protein
MNVDRFATNDGGRKFCQVMFSFHLPPPCSTDEVDGRQAKGVAGGGDHQDGAETNDIDKRHGISFNVSSAIESC